LLADWLSLWLAGYAGKNFLAGVGAGVVEAVFAVTPMESIKTVTIEQNLGLVGAVRFILRENGPSGLYKGVAATIMKQVSD
jgi:solute carrier family 25 citrate transporter 1